MNHLMFLLSLTGIVPITQSILPAPSTVYLITSQAVTWSDAQNYCRMQYTDLVRVNDNSVLLQLRQMAANFGIATWPIWIGLYNDINSWRWSLNNLPLNSTGATNWYTGQPDNNKGIESCGGIFSPGYWGDYDCSLPKPFICYNAGNSGADRFVGVSSPQMNWTEAQKYCQTFHTDLASSLNQTDNDLLAQVASVQGPSWFGLFRDTWKWLNRTVATNILWNPGQPDNSSPPENCAALQYGLFKDEPCSYSHYFFCELCPPVWTNIIKVQVKSDGSVLDPAVQSSILNQLSQKLEAYGKWNTTVSWRVQPNGNIFNKKNKDDL